MISLASFERSIYPCIRLGFSDRPPAKLLHYVCADVRKDLRFSSFFFLLFLGHGFRRIPTPGSISRAKPQFSAPRLNRPSRNRSRFFCPSR